MRVFRAQSQSQGRRIAALAQLLKSTARFKIATHRKILRIEVLASLALLNFHLKAEQSVNQLLFVALPTFAPDE
jgi:hypothetical protein